eukprot:m.71451 g.71451  ORF g.71451 m.71451 type:complete len:290 (-) comp10069_c0_seq2:1225-2094(-)
MAAVQRVYVITGAGSGLGAVTTQALASNESTELVFALDRHFPPNTAFVGAEKVQNVICDVTSQGSISAAVDTVCAALQILTNEPGIDGIVHFAGINKGGPLMEMDPHDLEITFGVNVIGVVRVQKAFFSLLQRRAGATVLISSEVALPRLVTAFSAPYAVSKIAIEGVAVALRQELQMLQPPMPVVVINPGACRTPMLVASIASNFSTYAEAGSIWERPLRRGQIGAEAYMERNMGPPQAVADAVVAALENPTRQQRIIVNRSWEMFVLGWLPQWLVDVLFLFNFGPVR